MTEAFHSAGCEAGVLDPFASLVMFMTLSVYHGKRTQMLRCETCCQPTGELALEVCQPTALEHQPSPNYWFRAPVMLTLKSVGCQPTAGGFLSNYWFGVPVMQTLKSVGCQPTGGGLLSYSLGTQTQPKLSVRGASDANLQINRLPTYWRLSILQP